MSTIKIAPSILAADFARLGEEVRDVVEGGCDYVHVDVMDGHFVPNISIGPPVVKALKRVTECPLDVHLMIEDPDRYLESFADAGADIITVHVEATRHLHRTLSVIRALGVRAGISINPATSLSTIEWVLEQVDMVLVMSVNPGFGGQSFIESALPRLRRLRRMIAEQGRPVDIEVDGGVVVGNAAQVASCGANVLVSGTGIFRSADYGSAIAAMRLAAEQAYEGPAL